jgi:phage-related protein/DNA-binding XRE family transcriptional regulator
MAAQGKPLVWLRGEVKTPPFSHEARLEAGTLLRRLQLGETLTMPHSRPMPAIGARCHELRIKDLQHEWRIVYRVDRDAVLILDVFAKASRKTPDRRRLPEAPHVVRAGSVGKGGIMKNTKREALERAGWRVGTVKEFLGLSEAEVALVELRLALSRSLRARRARRGLSQQQLASLLGSSQSRVAKMEAGDPSVSLDLLIRSLLAMGATRKDVGNAIVRPPR